MKPTVWIPEAVLERLDIYMEAAEGEISGLGRVTRRGEALYVQELFLLPQRCDMAKTEMEPEGVHAFLLDLLERDQRPEEVKLWWHSHGTMNVFWSGTDDTTAESFANGWMLSLVGNKRGALLARLDIYEPFKVTVDNLEVRILKPSNPALEEELYNEVAAKVTKIPPPVYIKPAYWKRGEPTADWEPRQIPFQEEFDVNGDWIGG